MYGNNLNPGSLDLNPPPPPDGGEYQPMSFGAKKTKKRKETGENVKEKGRKGKEKKKVSTRAK